MTTRWFGPSCNGASRDEVSTPEGELCAWCGEPVAKGDQGVELPHHDGSTWSYRPWHEECLMRSLIGSMAHIEGRCSCFGGTDEPAVNKREEAKKVYTRWYKAGS